MQKVVAGWTIDACTVSVVVPTCFMGWRSSLSSASTHQLNSLCSTARSHSVIFAGNRRGAYEVRDSNFGDPVFWVFGLSDTAVCAHLEKHAAKQANQNTSGKASKSKHIRQQPTSKQLPQIDWATSADCASRSFHTHGYSKGTHLQSTASTETRRGDCIQPLAP